jgi:hypothetical protein
MPGNHSFEYAVIRVVPKGEREEFLNVGVIVYCPGLKFLQVMFTLNEDRLRAFSPDLDIEEIKEHLCAYEHVCKGGTNGGPIGKLDMPSRFRWLTATKSTVVQMSKVHPGLCENGEETLRKLHEKLVL